MIKERLEERTYIIISGIQQSRPLVGKKLALFMDREAERDLGSSSSLRGNRQLNFNLQILTAMLVARV